MSFWGDLLEGVAVDWALSAGRKAPALTEEDKKITARKVFEAIAGTVCVIAVVVFIFWLWGWIKI